MLSGQAIVIVGEGAIGGHFLAAAQHLGARCAVIARARPAANVPYQRADVTSLEELAAAADATFAALGRVDTVIDVVGTHHKPMDLAKDDHAAMLAEFERVMRVNLHGAFTVTMVFAKHLVRQRHGHLIHLASNASRLSLYGSYAYNASKHGLEGLIKTAAAQLAPFNVRVNGLAPGTVETDLNRHLLRGGEGGQLTARAASILAHTPTKRFATLDGISESLAALCIPQRHLTGNIVFCDDGYNIEGHSWPAGNEAVYGGEGALDALYARLEEQYPHG